MPQLAGIITYGAFGKAANGKNDYDNTNCCRVALKES